MCGIAGIYKFSSNNKLSLEHSIKGMLSVIRHRGPDESGMYLGEAAGIGSVRLSIIDPESGQQPISDESGNYWIVYNGEIFNYVELRNDIEKKGIRLKTKCDSEVVVQMYAMYGDSCLQYFNGEFAFCIWNKKTKEFFLARDRVGIRPLFYYAQENMFAFCSEIKGLFTLNQIDKTLSAKNLAQVFTFWTTIFPNTPFEKIYSLPPGHQMLVKDSELLIKKYWELDFACDECSLSNSSESDTVEEFSNLLKDAVKIRLRADVPVGAYLSGGLDSSIITSLIHEIDPNVLNTFSIGFKDEVFDETPYQSEVSKYFNTNHIAFKCTGEEIADHFENTIWHTEFPILRTAPTPLYILSKKVRQQDIKVVLTGEGADEFMGGYDIFKESKIRRFWAKQPNSVIRPKLLSRLYSYLPVLKNSSDTALKMFFGYKLTETNDPLYSHLLRWHNTSRIKNFFSKDVISNLNGYDPLESLYPILPPHLKKWSGLAKSQYLEIAVFMSGYLLSSQGDRMSMANSVEGRYPFLDYRVIEYCNKLPDHYKLNCLNEKFLLKKISRGRIPESITRRTKQPYRAPIASSFSNSDSQSYISEMLSEKCIKSFGLFDPIKVNSLIRKKNNQKEISEVDQMAFIGILSTQLLYKMFIHNPILPDINNLSNLKIIFE